MTIKEALREGSIQLKNSKEARILLSHYLQKDALSLILIEDRILDNPQAYFNLIKRAINHEPIEYITNKVSFYSQEFHIQKGVLIPRPETEILIDKTLKIAKKLKHPRIAEIGVGSGIISIMIARAIKDITIVATDISQEALDIAKINAQTFGVADKITFIHTPYIPDVHTPYDIIVSNPPYIAKASSLEKNLAYEPDIALFGGEVGDEILKNIIDLTTYQPTCTLCCEMGYDQKDSLQTYLREKGFFDIEFYQDWSDFDRGFTATFRRAS
jgi:release factor glutamine methyltransferase